MRRAWCVDNEATQLKAIPYRPPLSGADQSRGPRTSASPPRIRARRADAYVGKGGRRAACRALHQFQLLLGVPARAAEPADAAVAAAAAAAAAAGAHYPGWVDWSCPRLLRRCPPSPPPPVSDGVNYCGGTKVAAAFVRSSTPPGKITRRSCAMAQSLSTAASAGKDRAWLETLSRLRHAHAVAVVNGSSMTTTRDVEFVATQRMNILKTDENGIIKTYHLVFRAWLQ